MGVEQGGDDQLTKRAFEFVQELYVHVLSLGPNSIHQTQDYHTPTSVPYPYQGMYSQLPTFAPIVHNFPYQPFVNSAATEPVENKEEISVSMQKQQDPVNSFKEKRRPSFSKLIEKGYLFFDYSVNHLSGSAKFLKAMNRNRVSAFWCVFN